MAQCPGAGSVPKHAALEPRGHLTADGITDNSDNTEKQPEGPIRFRPGIGVVFLFTRIARMQNLPAVHALAAESQSPLKVRRNISGIGECRHGNTWKTILPIGNPPKNRRFHRETGIYRGNFVAPWVNICARGSWRIFRGRLCFPAAEKASSGP